MTWINYISYIYIYVGKCVDVNVARKPYLFIFKLYSIMPTLFPRRDTPPCLRGVTAGPVCDHRPGYISANGGIFSAFKTPAFIILNLN